MPEPDRSDQDPHTPEDPPAADASRRRFLKFLAVGAGVAAAAGLGGKFLFEKFVPSPDQRIQGSPRDSWVMLIDLDRCDGCGQCTTACQTAHVSPAGQQWIQVYQVKDEKGGSFYLPRPCFQCRNAPCQKVCPVGATFIDRDGIVLVDHRRCIGCRYCMAACPYNARSFNWTQPTYPAEALAHPYSPEAPWPVDKGVVMKCVFCAHNVRDGKLPECVSACPMGAIYFGNEAEDAVTNSRRETLPFRATLVKEGGFRWKEELGTDPRVYYLPARR